VDEPIELNEKPQVQQAETNKNSTPVVINRERMNSPELTFDRARNFGTFYESMVKTLTGELDQPDLTVLDSQADLKEQAEQIAMAIAAGRVIQQGRMELGQMGGKELLGQVFKGGAAAEVIADASQYRFHEFSSGVYGIFINDEAFRKLYDNQAQAVAIRPKDGVSFVLIPEYSEETHREANQRLLEENIPHEMEHIMWGFLTSQGLIKTDELDLEVQKAFTMYQDELIARLSSDGGLMGNSHLNLISEEERRQILDEKPDIAKGIYTQVGELNSYLSDTLDPKRKQTDVKKSDLILAVVNATTFSGIKNGMQQMEEIIDSRPKTSIAPPASQNGGWGAV